MADNFTSKKNGAAWIQPDGPNTAPQYLGCVDVDEIEEPQGSIELQFCIDANGDYVAKGSTEEPPDPVSTTLETYLAGTRDALESAVAPYNLFLHTREGGRADVFQNYKRSAVVRVQKVTSRTRDGLVKKDEDVASMLSLEVEGLPPLLDAFLLTALRQGVAETQQLNDIAVNYENRKASPVGPALKPGYEGAISANAASAATPNVLHSSTGANWTAGAADPFAANEHAGPAVRVYIGAVLDRIIVGRSVTDAGNPAEIAYSDDNGVTWTLVNVGSTNAQYLQRGGSIFALDQFNIWAVSTGGYVYKSSDGGLTWTTQDAGAATTANLTQVRFLDANNGWACGATNVILRTRNGGLSWGLVAGPAGKSAVTINAIVPVTENRVWLAFNDGTLYYTEDAGVTWNLRSGPWSGAGVFNGLDFVNEMFGIAARTLSGVGTLYQTIDGGYTWQALTTPTNAGFTQVRFITPTLAYALGAASGGTGVIVRASA